MHLIYPKTDYISHERYPLELFIPTRITYRSDPRPKKVHNTNLTQNRTVGVDNTLITPNRRYYPPRRKYYTRDI